VHLSLAANCLPSCIPWWDYSIRIRQECLPGRRLRLASLTHGWRTQERRPSTPARQLCGRWAAGRGWPAALQRSQRWRLPGIAPKTSLCLCASVVRSVVAGYNYQLVVIANRHRFPKSCPPEKLSIPDRSHNSKILDCSTSRRLTGFQCL